MKNFLYGKIDGLVRKNIGISARDALSVLNGSPSLSSLSDLEKIEENQPKSIGGSTSLFLPKIEKDFPNFNNYDAENAIKKFMFDFIHYKYGENISFGDNVQKNLIDTIEVENSKHTVSDIVINKISIFNYKKVDEYANIVYRCSIGYTVNGSRIETKYEIEYTLKLKDNNVADKAMICPNCNATIDTTETVCPYCNSKIVRDTVLNWFFTDINKI